MKRKILVVMLAVSLVGVCSSGAAAGILGYNLDKADQGFTMTQKGTSSAQVATDALIARPLGVAVTVLGTALFIATLPTSIGSGTTRETAQKLVGAPGGWTFVRPLGQRDPRFAEKGVFGR